MNPTIKVYMEHGEDEKYEQVELEVSGVEVDENNLIQIYVRNPLE